jgi:hypothetical protein
MTSEASLSNRDFFPVLLKGYFLGAIVSALVLRVAIAIIAPGDGGTWLALTGAGIYLPMLLILDAVGLVVFPLAAIASWPFRDMVFRKPLIASLCSAGCGVLVGAAATAIGIHGGPGDFWSGPLVGLTYGVVWFVIVKISDRRVETTIA